MNKKPPLDLSNKHIFLALDDHTDYMWSADEEAYRQAFLEMLDYYVEKVAETAGEPPEFQSRFCCDGTLWVWEYEKNRSPAQFARLIEAIRSGHITIPLNPVIQTYGGAPLEATLRGMFYAGKLERRHGLRFALALAMENQTMPYGLGMVWAGSGAKYSWKGICACASHTYDAWDRPHDIYWWAGPDGSRILMKWNSLLLDNKNMGGYAEARDPKASLELVENNSEFRRRYPYPIIGIFGKGWDDLKTLNQDFVAFARQHTTMDRKIIVSNEIDFFEAFEQAFGSRLPVECSSYGNEWDLYTASLAEVFARVRRSAEKLRAAEALAVLTGLNDPALRAQPSAEKDQAWMDLGLFYEHDLTADGPISRDVRAAWHRSKAFTFTTYVDRLHAQASAALGAQIQRGGDLPRFYVFNPLSWARSGAACLPYDIPGPVHVVDLANGRQVPAQAITQDGAAYLQILAENNPPLGYKVFEVRPGVGDTFDAPLSFNGNRLENEFCRVTIAENGAIDSWIDKTHRNRELVQPAGGLNDLGTVSAKIRLERSGPVSLTVLVESDQPLKHTRRYTLVRGQPGIEIHNEILQNFGDELAWSFRFNLDAPEVWHEEVGAVIRARLLRDGGHYAEKCARYDWLTLNHFADISAGDGYGVTLSNADCAFMRLGNSSIKKLDSATSRIQVLAGGQVDGPNLGIHYQGGEEHFTQRFALRARERFNPGEAMRFALEHQNPFITGPVQGGGDLPSLAEGEQFSLLAIDNPDVLLWALKPAEDGWDAGIIVRLWNLSGQPAPFTLRLHGKRIEQAGVVTHIETPLRAAGVSQGAVTETLAPYQIGTFSIKLS